MESHIKKLDTYTTEMATDTEKIDLTNTIRDRETHPPIVVRPKLSRTPPQRRVSLPDLETRPQKSNDAEHIRSGTDSEEERASKRKRTDAGVQGDTREGTGLQKPGLVRTITRSLREIDAVSKTMDIWARERNTKKELKEAAIKLRGSVTQLKKGEVQDFLNSLDDLTNTQEQLKKIIGEKEILEIQNKNLTARIAELQKKEMAATRAKGTPRQEEVTEERLRAAGSYGAYRELRDLNWPNSIYKTAFCYYGSPLDRGKDTDLVFPVQGPGEVPEDDPNKRLIEGRNPELKELEGRFAALVVSSKKIEGGAVVSLCENTIYKIENSGQEEEWFNSLVQVRDGMETNRRAKVVICPPPYGGMVEKTKRMAECVFRGVGIKCLICTPQSRGERHLKKRRDKHENTEAIVIEQRGRTYADLLRSVKEKIRPGTVAAEGIKTIRESREGAMVIVMDRAKQASNQALKDELKRPQHELRVSERSGRKPATLTVRGIDATTIKEEVLEAVKGALDSENRTMEEVGLSELRPSFGSSRAVTIRASREIADTLLRLGKIRIGLCWCAVEERLEVLQCYRCWGYGHKRGDCKDQDRTNACKKCGENGHLGKDCLRESFCLNCKAPGHGAGSERCPLFRDALRKVRLGQKKKKAY